MPTKPRTPLSTPPAGEAGGTAPTFPVSKSSFGHQVPEADFLERHVEARGAGQGNLQVFPEQGHFFNQLLDENTVLILSRLVPQRLDVEIPERRRDYSSGAATSTR